MRLNKIEKIVVVIIVIGLILGLGIFMFVKPSFEKIGTEQKTLENYQKELAELNEKLSRLDTIDADIQAQKDSALKYEKTFYPEMTTYEVSEMAMAYLAAANLEAHSISVTQISTSNLSLSYFVPNDVSYVIKEQAAAAKSDPDAEDTTLEEGEFMDGNKKYVVVVDSVTNVHIYDENNEEVAVNKFTDTMKKVYKAGVCRYAVANAVTQTPALMQATYTVSGAYKDYMDFIDHIYALDRATSFTSVTIPMTVSPTSDEDDEDNGTKYYVDEAGNVVSEDEVKANQEVPVEDDTIIEQNVTLLFFAIDPMVLDKTVDADGTAIVIDQRPAVY